MQKGPSTSVLLSVVASLLVSLGAAFSFGQSTNDSTHARLPAPVIPQTNSVESDSPPNVNSYIQSIQQPFTELIDDAVVGTKPTIAELIMIPSCELNAPCAGQCPDDCQCSIEAGELTALEAEQAFEEVDEWAELMNCPCTVHSCDTPLNHLPPNTPPANDPEDYCQQLARLLAPTLESTKITSEKKQQSIQAAMKMVAEKALESAEARIAEMKIEHRQEILELQNKIASTSARSDTQELVEAWLRPIMANQRANQEQIRLMAASAKSLNRTMLMWEKRMAMLTEPLPPPIPKPLPEQVVPAAYSTYKPLQRTRQAEHTPLRPIPPPRDELTRANEMLPRNNVNEIQELRAELHAMRISQRQLLERLTVAERLSAADQRATNLDSQGTHRLEPLYVSDALLTPIPAPATRR